MSVLGGVKSQGYSDLINTYKTQGDQGGQHEENNNNTVTTVSLSLPLCSYLVFYQIFLSPGRRKLEKTHIERALAGQLCVCKA